MVNFVANCINGGRSGLFPGCLQGFDLRLNFKFGLTAVLARRDGVACQVGEAHTTALAAFNLDGFFKNAVSGFQFFGTYFSEHRAFFNL